MKTSPEELEREVESIREGMTPILSELDHRRHDLTDWGHQLRQRGPILLKSLAVVAGLVTVVKLVQRRGRKRRARRGAAVSSTW